MGISVPTTVASLLINSIIIITLFVTQEHIFYIQYHATAVCSKWENVASLGSLIISKGA